LAQLEARHELRRPLLVHAILETALGVTNVEEICAASPRMQGISFGPADLAASRRMKTTRVGGGHPAYLVRTDPDPKHPDAPRPTAQQDPWHYSIARMVDACAATGCLPFYGPFGDISDPLGCEDQFRAAFLLGCVGAWSLHPSQIDIAKRVFSPPVEEVAFAKRVLEAMPDGRGVLMLDGKMQADAGGRAPLLPMGRGEIELLEPIDAAGGVAKFLARRGEGLHHVCFETPDVAAELAAARGAGLPLIDEAPRRGLAGMICFLHPK